MNLNLPKEILWTDIQSMEQFFELEPLCENFCEVLKTLQTKPFDIKSDEMKVCNEVFYQLTRMVYERPSPADLKKYEADIKRNMGWNYSVELVMSMLYFLHALIKNKECIQNRFFMLNIMRKYKICVYWEPFAECCRKIGRATSVTYDFHPRPVAPHFLADKYVPWQEITINYDTAAIIEILSKWDSEKDRLTVLEMMKTSLNFSTPRLQRAYYNQVSSVLHSSLFGNGNNVKKASELEERINHLDSKLMLLQKENATFQKLTNDLIADNNRLKALLEEKDIHGEARKFTLVEIVNYCKGRVEWNEAKDIVAMLNRLLLLHGGTPEDNELVISIESEFKNRKYGNTYVKSQTYIPNVVNYNEMVKNQNNNFPAPERVADLKQIG